VVPQLISYGRILRPIIGVELASDSWVRRYRIEGLPVVQVYPGLPAHKAGMTGAYRGSRGEVVLGDVITGIDGKPVRGNDDYLDVLENKQPGDTVRITTRRGEQEKTFKLELIESQ
jgi:S1-C subfamily serine protease